MSELPGLLADITHAKPANLAALSLRQPCGCGSKLRFRRCCYSTVRTGWCWLLLGQRKFEPIAIHEPALATCPVIMAQPSCETALSYIMSSGMSKRIPEPIWLIRLPVGRVVEILTYAFPTEHLLIVLPEECCPFDQEPVIELNPPAPSPAPDTPPELDAPVPPRPDLCAGLPQ